MARIHHLPRSRSVRQVGHRIRKPVHLSFHDVEALSGTAQLSLYSGLVIFSQYRPPRNGRHSERQIRGRQADRRHGLSHAQPKQSKVIRCLSHPSRLRRQTRSSSARGQARATIATRTRSKEWNECAKPIQVPVAVAHDALPTLWHRLHIDRAKWFHYFWHRPDLVDVPNDEPAPELPSNSDPDGPLIPRVDRVPQQITPFQPTGTTSQNRFRYTITLRLFEFHSARRRNQSLTTVPIMAPTTKATAIWNQSELIALRFSYRQ